MGGILVADTNFKFCAACGRKVALNAQFCAGCGAALGAKEKSVQSGTTPTQQELTAEELSDKGYRLAKSGCPQEAVQCFDTALAIDPRYVYAWMEKGSALYDLNRYQEAIQCYDKALAIAPQLGSTWTNKGAALYWLGRYQEALQCFDKALAIDPKIAEAQVFKRVVLEEIRKTTPHKWW
jgi:tetratricopeptide (TPR) repeat protein